MRVNLIGNVLNLALIFGKFLHQRGHRVKVFIDKKDPEPYLPQWEFPEFQNGFPEWVEMVDVDLKRLFIPGAKERSFIKRLKECDIIQAFGESVIWAGRTGRPCIFLSYGGDLDILPFYTSSIKGFIFARLLRDALNKAAIVLYTMPQQRRSVIKLNLTNGRFFPCAIPIDTDRYRPFSQDERKRLRAEYKADYIFFHPARQAWTYENNNKGNNELFKAFARFVKDNKKETLLIAVEKGSDVEKSKALIKQLEIERYVKWIRPVDKPRLIEMLNAADMCFDDFGYGFYGLATLEALSVGTPTFSYLDKELAGREAPPIINVKSSDQIYEGMAGLASDRNKLKEIGKNSREWALEHHRCEKVINRYLDLYEEVLGKQ